MKSILSLGTSASPLPSGRPVVESERSGRDTQLQLFSSLEARSYRAFRIPISKLRLFLTTEYVSSQGLIGHFLHHKVHNVTRFGFTIFKARVP